MIDTLGKILKTTSAHMTIKKMIVNDDTIRTFLNDEFTSKNIEDIFSRTASTWNAWAEISADHSSDYKKICVSLINTNLLDSHLNALTAQYFIASNIDEINQPLAVLGKIAAHGEGKKNQ